MSVRQAVRALLETDEHLAGRIVDVTSTLPPPYVVVQVRDLEDEWTRLASGYSDSTAQIITTAVGESVEQAEWWADAVDARLRPAFTGARLSVPGVQCSPLKRIARELDTDRDLLPAVRAVVAVYETTITPG